MAMIQVELVGRNSYLCRQCMSTGKDPIKSTGTPHCLDCGKHHPIHIDCKGKERGPESFMQCALFYGGQYIDSHLLVGVA